MSTLAPKPLPGPVAPAAGKGDREALFQVEPAPVFGEPLPKSAVRLELVGTHAKLGPSEFDLERADQRAALKSKLAQAVLISTDEDTYLAQAAPLFALLDDASIETWILHPDGKVAFRVTLRDEPAFQKWIDEPKPGKIRIIQRADGFELQTNVGKLPGPDPNGPTVPVRGGELDIATLRKALGKLKGRFDTTPDVCLVPSYGTELAHSARALTADYTGPGERIFDELCLVYPRPAAKR